MVQFVCDFVVFEGYLLCRLLISFVRKCQCYCFGGGYIIFAW